MRMDRDRRERETTRCEGEERSGENGGTSEFEGESSEGDDSECVYDEERPGFGNEGNWFNDCGG